MRPNQLSMLVVRFDEKEVEGIPRIISVYADSRNVWKAINMAVSAVTMQSLGQKVVPAPRFCSCEVLTDLDEEELHQRHIRFAWKCLKAKLLDLKAFSNVDELLNDREDSGRVLVHLHLQRFPKATPKEYPKDEQTITIDWLGEDVFTGLANVCSLLSSVIREYEPISDEDALSLKTNIDEVNPLVGSLEAVRIHSEELSKRRDS